MICNYICHYNLFLLPPCEQYCCKFSNSLGNTIRQANNSSIHHPPSIHYLSLLFLCRVAEGWNLSQLTLAKAGGSPLDRSPGHHRADAYRPTTIQTHIHTYGQITVTN